jgi:hypothetical protein
MGRCRLSQSTNEYIEETLEYLRTHHTQDSLIVEDLSQMIFGSKFFCFACRFDSKKLLYAGIGVAETEELAAAKSLSEFMERIHFEAPSDLCFPFVGSAFAPSEEMSLINAMDEFTNRAEFALTSAQQLVNVSGNFVPLVDTLTQKFSEQLSTSSNSTQISLYSNPNLSFGLWIIQNEANCITGCSIGRIQTTKLVEHSFLEAFRKFRVSQLNNDTTQCPLTKSLALDKNLPEASEVPGFVIGLCKEIETKRIGSGYLTTVKSYPKMLKNKEYPFDHAYLRRKVLDFLN